MLALICTEAYNDILENTDRHSHRHSVPTCTNRQAHTHT